MDLGDRIRWLGQHRLLHAAGLLVERGWLEPEVGELGLAMGDRFTAEDRLATAAEREVVEALADVGIRALLLKGSLLAHTVYPESGSRFRGDMDIQVAPASLESAASALTGLGFARSRISARPTALQSQWIRADDGFCIDLHWEISNRPALARVVDFAELEASAVPVPRLSPLALGLCRAHALLHACMHYFSHHKGVVRPLQWLLDMDLLWRAMSADEQAETMALAREKGLCGVLGAGLDLAVRHFATPVDPAELDDLLMRGRDERLSFYARAEHGSLAHWRFNVASMPSWAERLQYAFSTVLPPASFMRQIYPEGSGLGLPGLYARRLRESLRS